MSYLDKTPPLHDQPERRQERVKAMRMLLDGDYLYGADQIRCHTEMSDTYHHPITGRLEEHVVDGQFVHVDGLALREGDSRKRDDYDDY